MSAWYLLTVFLSPLPLGQTSLLCNSQEKNVLQVFHWQGPALPPSPWELSCIIF